MPGTFAELNGLYPVHFITIVSLDQVIAVWTVPRSSLQQGRPASFLSRVVA